MFTLIFFCVLKQFGEEIKKNEFAQDFCSFRNSSLRFILELFIYRSIWETRLFLFVFIFLKRIIKCDERSNLLPMQFKH